MLPENAHRRFMQHLGVEGASSSMTDPESSVEQSKAIHYTTAADGTAIAYEARGSGPPLLHARGWISNLEIQRSDPAIDRFFDPIREHRTVVRYDPRGNGVSDWQVPQPITMDDLLSDLEAVADEITEPVFDLWAATYAGPLAIEYVARHPERVGRVILDGTFAVGREFIDEAHAEAFFTMLSTAKTNPYFVFSSISFMTDPSPEVSHETRTDNLRKSISPDAIEQLYRLAYDFDVSDLLHEIEHLVLILHREKSRAVPIKSARHLAAALPNARLQVLDGSAHNLHEGDWRSAVDAIADFLDIGPMTHRQAGPTERAPTELQVVLFTDIVGSTSLTARVGDQRAQAIVREHNRVVREALASESGTEIKHTGDGIMASFRGVTPAATAAIVMRDQIAALSDENDDDSLEVRIGLNAGEPVAEQGDLFGSSVQIAARVCDTADAGQIVVTDVVRELLRGKRMRFDDLGMHALRGVDDDIRLWSLVAEERRAVARAPLSR